MTLDTALEHAASRGMANDVDAQAIDRLAREVERLQAIVSDAETLLQRFRASSGNEYFIDVRGKDLAAVLGRAT